MLKLTSGLWQFRMRLCPVIRRVLAHIAIYVCHTHTHTYTYLCLTVQHEKRLRQETCQDGAMCHLWIAAQLAAASATAAVVSRVSRVSRGLSHVSGGCHPQIFDFSPTINKTINQTCSTGQTNANTNAKYAAYSINFLFVLTIFEIFIAPPKCSSAVDCTASVSHVALAIVATAAAVAFACCRWVKRASSKNNSSNNNKRLSRLAKNGKNDKCFTATKKLQQQQQRRQQKSSIS